MKLALLTLCALALALPARAQAPRPETRAAAAALVPDAAALRPLPAVVLPWLRQGDAAMGKGEFSQAVGRYGHAVEAAPSEAIPRLMLGVALTSANRLKLAADQFERATRLAEDDLVARFLLIGARESNGEAAEAQRLYLELARDPRHRRKDRPGFDASRSVAILKAASEQLPESPVLALLLGDAHQLSEEFVGAEAAYRKAVKAAPRWIKPRVNLARLQIALGKPDRAVATIEAALGQDPDNVPAQLTKGEAQLRTGRTRDAIRTFQKLEKVESARVVAVTSIARANLKQGDLSGATRYIDRAQSLAPGDPGPRALQGEVQMRRGDFAGAALSYAAALRLTRESGLFDAQPSLFRALAEAQLAARRPADALLTLKDASTQEPDLTAIWQRLSADAHEALGDTVELEASLRRALEAETSLSPQETLNAIARRSLTEKLIAFYLTRLQTARMGVAGTPPAAPGTSASVTSAPVSREGEIVALSALGHLYRFRGEFAEEVSVRRDLCALQSSGPNWFLLAEAQERIAEWRDAQVSYRQALSRGGLPRAAWDRSVARLKALERRP